METVADKIEKYLKHLISKSPNGMVEVQRNSIAQKFSCVPSQITYVLGTRFTLENGYLVESRRGGGGYLKISRIIFNDFSKKQRMLGNDELVQLVNRTIGSMASQDVGEELISRLLEEGFLTAGEAKLMQAVIKRDTIPLGLPERDVVRACILRVMLINVLSDE